LNSVEGFDRINKNTVNTGKEVNMLYSELNSKKLSRLGFGAMRLPEKDGQVDKARVKEMVRYAIGLAKQQGKREVVLFNNGLHGWHLDDETEYRAYFDGFVKFLLDEFADTPVFVVLTTTVANDERNERVTVRNKVASEVAAKYGVGIIDLYAASAEAKELLSPDGVHFTPAGYEVLAAKILDTLTEAVFSLKV